MYVRDGGGGLTGEDWLDAVENDGDGEERTEVGHRVRGLAAGEEVAQLVAQAEHDGGAHHRHGERERRHDHHRERRRPRVAGPQLVPHPHAASNSQRDSYTGSSTRNLSAQLRRVRTSPRR
jgi:hypothetical protein